MNSFEKLPAETRQILNSLPALINKTFPLPSRFRGALPSDIAELSRLLTSQRGGRSLSYLSRPNFLSAYMHYFLPWNLFRLCILLKDLDIPLSQGSVITDLGSGPLTFITALWISRPDLRNVPLEVNCVDRCAPALEAGKKFFDSLSSGAESPWKINCIREDIDIRKTETIKKIKHASLVCAVNMFNEIYDNIPHNNPEKLRLTAVNAAKLMHNQALKNAYLFTAEPGIPQSGKFISLLRCEFLKLDRPAVSPCTHLNPCPYDPFKLKKIKKWCHFAYEAVNAPEELRRLSAASKIPKERLVLSYLLTGPVSQEKESHPAAKTGAEEVRVISDIFKLQNSLFGRYGCCSKGLVLLTGERNHMEKINSGSLVNFKNNTPVFAANGQRDAKSGALIMAAKIT